MAKIAETEVLSVASGSSELACLAPQENEDKPLVPEQDWRPKRLVRTLLSSLADLEEFGRQTARQAQGRRFPEAAAKAFLGDASYCAMGASCRSISELR